MFWYYKEDRFLQSLKATEENVFVLKLVLQQYTRDRRVPGFPFIVPRRLSFNTALYSFYTPKKH